MASAAQPGVQAVAVSHLQLIAGDNHGGNITVEQMDQSPNFDSNVNFNEVSPGFFSALGVPLVAGREFARTDNAASPKVVIIKETLAKRFFPTRNPIGVRMGFGGGNAVKLEYEIAGVVKDARYSQVRDEPPAVLYQPYA